MRHYAILANHSFDYISAKTGNAIIRYRPEEVVCVIDSETAGRTVQDVLGWGGDIPVVATLKEAFNYSPDTLLIGIAPPGGELPILWRKTISLAIENKLNVINGLHTFLLDDPEFSSLSTTHGVSIIDLRRPPDSLHFPKGTWQERKIPVLLTVGTDCDSGKMITAWEIKRLLEKRGKRVAFVGTGQTGILLGGFGVAVDAVVSDFIAGSIEAEIDKAEKDHDLVIVEGQGSITHMAYSGVTCGLLHGTMPDMMVICHEAERNIDTFNYPMFPIADIMDLYLRLVTLFKPSEFVGISLITQDMSEKKARETLHSFEKEYGLPTTDFFRFSGIKIVDNILAHLAGSSS